MYAVGQSLVNDPNYSSSGRKANRWGAVSDQQSAVGNQWSAISG